MVDPTKYSKMEEVLKNIKEIVEGVEEQHSQNINLELALQQDSVLNEIYQVVSEIV